MKKTNALRLLDAAKIDYVAREYDVSDIDETAILYDTIFVSGGRIGLQIEIAMDDLVKMTGAKVCDLTVVS